MGGRGGAPATGLGAVWVVLRAQLSYLRIDPADYQLVRALFLRGVALVYGIAFLSLWVQVEGLLGAGGILPANAYLEAVTRHLGAAGYLRLPTLLWLGAGDAALHLLCGAGALLAGLVCWGVAPAPCLALLWICYLSLFNVGQDFLSFQWDILLLETGFIALLWAPGTWRPGRVWAGTPSVAALWLVRWLLFRLVFSSGAVKLLSDDPTWRDLTAMTYHYQTQPLPHAVAWFADKLPLLLHQATAVSMFLVELVVPFLIFAPRRARLSACGALVILQLAIGATGNYGFFNILTVVLCFSLLDDRIVRRWLPVPASWRAVTAPGRWRSLPRIAVCILLLLLSARQLSQTLRLEWAWPQPVLALNRHLGAFRLVGGYGLFAVMTTVRREIQVEGSHDGHSWRAYRFRWKPDREEGRPGLAQPHMPRLDWQMWFAALRPHRENSWFAGFLSALLEGREDVLNLLEENPFSSPPKYVRSRLYRHEFGSWDELWSSGRWWRRELLGDYTDIYTLER